MPECNEAKAEEDSGQYAADAHFLPLGCGEHLCGRRPLRSKSFFTYNADDTTALEIMAMGAVRCEARLPADPAFFGAEQHAPEAELQQRSCSSGPV